MLNSLLLPCNYQLTTWHGWYNWKTCQIVSVLLDPLNASSPLRYNHWCHILFDPVTFHTLYTLSSHTNLLGYAAKPHAACKWAKLPAKRDLNAKYTCIKKQHTSVSSLTAPKDTKIHTFACQSKVKICCISVEMMTTEKLLNSTTTPLSSIVKH